MHGTTEKLSYLFFEWENYVLTYQKTMSPIHQHQNVLSLNKTCDINTIKRFIYRETGVYFSIGPVNKGNNKITELRTILQRESQNS